MRPRLLYNIAATPIPKTICSRSCSHNWWVGHSCPTSNTAREGKMPKPINLITTLKGSLLENFYPQGWNLQKIDRCCAMNLKQLTTPAKFWNSEFLPRPVADVAEMDRRMGDEIADQIESTRREGRKLAIILPVGHMGM